MPDLIAIVAKGIFEQEAKQGGKLLAPGQVFATDRYVSKNKALAPLAQGGRLVLVTVRPPNERLWLVAILDNPTFGPDPATKIDMWRAAHPNATPIVDITALRKTIKLATGKGLSQDKGALGMSLQTPRALAAEDMVAILDALAGPGDRMKKLTAELPASVTDATRALLAELGAKADDEALREKIAHRLVSEGATDAAMRLLAAMKHLNMHGSGDLPCLCKRHIAQAPAEVTAAGVAFARSFVCNLGRVLHFWAPRELFADPSTLTSMRMSLGRRIKRLDRERKQRARMRTR
ncbi:MAG: hypothetical protein U0441_22000 [Polyangiaceae bacterium]